MGLFERTSLKVLDLPPSFTPKCGADCKVKAKLIPGYQGFYKVRTDGTVWTRRIPGPNTGIKGPWKKMSPRPHRRSGHLRVKLTNPQGGKKEVFVHRLVLEAFVGPCPEGMECRHYPDQNPANNNLDNIQWGTKLQNYSDRGRGGSGKLTIAKARRIRALRKTGIHAKQLAKRFRVSVGMIYMILRGDCWSSKKRSRHGTI